MTHTLPPRAGVGLKAQHVAEILDTCPDIGFVEVHAENYMVPGGRFHRDLHAITERCALSIHGVGLSIGGAGPLDTQHLQRLQALLKRHPAAAFSEHLAWSSHGPWYGNDLLPVAYTHDSLQRVCEHIDLVQNTLGRPMLLENPSTYLQWGANDMSETDFLCQVLQRTGCGLLLDINNVYVSCTNHGWSPMAYLQAVPLERIGEIHLAGFAQDTDAAGDRLLIDHHGDAVAPAVWALYEHMLQRIGRPVATLIERDNNIPPWPVLMTEVQCAQDRLDRVAERPV